MAAEIVFAIACGTMIAAGAAHVLLTLSDVRRPRFFTPVDDRVRPAVDRTTIRFRELFPLGDTARPSMWSAWLGFNLSHGVGLIAFGGLCLLLALSDFDLVTETDGVMPLSVIVSATYVALAIRFWFWGPLLVVSASTACFLAAWILA